MGLTQSQQNAVDVRGRTLLVSAAAGSGKTYTLTQRIIKAIIDDGQDLSRLLIVTFTRAAAGELKAKISKALGEAIAEHPEDTHLQRQLIKLGQAHISTIDSFFSEPVRTNFEKLGLPASMRLSDDAELSPIREKLLTETLNGFFGMSEHYANEQLSPVGYRNRYTELLGIISGARDTSNILPTFFDIYKKLITSPIGLEQLKKHAIRLKENSKLDFFETLEGKALKEELVSTVGYAWKTFIKCSDDMQSDSFVASKYTADFIDNAELCHSLLNVLEKGSYDEIRKACAAYAPGKITSISTKEKTQKSEYYKDLRAELNKKIKDIIKDRLYMAQNELQELFLTYSDMCYLLYEILLSFDKKYSEEKKRRGICEFSDMPQFMLTLLLNDDGTLTEYAKTLYESYDEVYIDEYQDVNEIQDTIFAIIGSSHRFMVGDIKQSIYGFREAEPSIFAGYRKNFPIYEKNANECTVPVSGNTIFMSENFRCDENVISFTNEVCSRIFSAFSESIGYTSSDDLKFGKGRPNEDYESPKITLNIVQTPKADETDDTDDVSDGGSTNENSKNLGDEAIVVANQIADILRNGTNADGTPITSSDIAVLVRSHVYTEPLANALNKLNIKYALSSKGELFENEDMRLLVDLLSVIDNPRSDMPLCHILTTKSDSFTPDFTLEEIIKIRKSADSSLSLYDTLLICSGSEDSEFSEKCAAFITTIEKMRDAATRMSADKLIKCLISSKKYSSLTSTDAFTYLYDSACRFVKNTWGGLYSFIRYFKDVMEKGDSGSDPDPKIRDAVRIMSIHQSKGLEFNVCFLFGFGKQFNMQNRFPIIFNKEFGPYMKLPPENSANVIENIRARYQNNPIFKTVDKYNKLKQLEEEARIFYVALTRARERLYISATLSKPYAQYLQELSECADQIYEIKRSRSYINWILLTVTSSDTVSDICRINVHDKLAVSLTERFRSESVIRSSQKDVDENEKLLASLLSSPMSEDKTAMLLSNIPSKVAASKVSSHMLDDSVFIPIPTGKLFSDSDDAESLNNDSAKIIKARIELMRSAKNDFDSLLAINKKPTSAEIGTATHAFLQFCNYENIDRNGIENEIERLKQEKFITERISKIIDRTKLEGFFQSELYRLASTAASVRREFRFGMFRSATDFTEDPKLKKLVSDKKIFVQGSVDLLIESKNGDILLCDYKTDRITAEERRDKALLTENMQRKHGDQLKQYAHAIEKIFGRPPAKIFIFLMSLGDLIEIC